jgi:ABC-2 type transport system permease protein
LALVLQLFIAAFSSFLLVGLVSLYDPDRAETSLDSRVAYVGPGPFANYLRDESNLDVIVLEQQEALRLFNEAQVDAVIEEMYDDADGIRTINILLPESELRTTLLVTLLKDHLKGYERDLRAERDAQIQTQVVHVVADVQASPFFSFAYALLVPLLLTVPIFLSGAIAADAITQEVETRTLELLRASPAGGRGIFLGKIFAPILLTPMQGILWIILFGLNGIQVHNPLPILLLMTAFSTVLVCAAVFFGLGLKKQGDAQIAYSLLVLVVFAATYLLPQPLLSTFARLAVGSLTPLEWTNLVGLSVVALAGVLLGSRLAPRMIQRAA